MTMQSFTWHRDQKAIFHCLAAILTLADYSNMHIHEPMQAEWTSRFISNAFTRLHSFKGSDELVGGEQERKF